ncbi:hypothetical protein AALP_AA1G234100 [Arabis alpina]|uniref:Uncharacterized protein n=1 Tax=Arabis alpina TaxID=50452 RepID=A0A087HQ47_ARAAL|nr:hypothetical protein AALP_AA1G234100 [Arabis alpina]
MNSEQEMKPFKKKEGSVFPKKRELVKTKVAKNAYSLLLRTVCKQSSDPSSDGDGDRDGKRVYPTRF